jgi:hypothetical protein
MITTSCSQTTDIIISHVLYEWLFRKKRSRNQGNTFGLAESINLKRQRFQENSNFEHDWVLGIGYWVLGTTHAPPISRKFKF